MTNVNTTAPVIRTGSEYSFQVRGDVALVLTNSTLNSTFYMYSNKGVSMLENVTIIDLADIYVGAQGLFTQCTQILVKNCTFKNKQTYFMLYFAGGNDSGSNAIIDGGDFRTINNTLLPVNTTNGYANIRADQLNVIRIKNNPLGSIYNQFNLAKITYI
jgi:hypothetical protein